jgi:hypothetical protein
MPDPMRFFGELIQKKPRSGPSLMAGMNRILIAIDDNPADAFFVDLDTTFEEEISIELVPIS